MRNLRGKIHKYIIQLKMKAVIFDLDGVLVDSEPAQGKASRDLFARYGKKYTERHEQEFLGVRAREEIAILKRRWKLAPTIEVLMAQRRQILGRLINQVELMSGAVELLQWLAEINLPLGLGTSSEAEYVNRILENLGIKNYFKVIVTGDDVVRGKPDPEVYLKVARGLGVAPKECVVIEDAPNGAAAARAAGMQCWMVTDSLMEVKRWLTNI